VTVSPGRASHSPSRRSRPSLKSAVLERASSSGIRVVVWGEYIVEQADPEVAAIYPDGIHEEIARGVRERCRQKVTVRAATFSEREHGLPEEILANTDVLVWSSPSANERVSSKVASRVHSRVLEGMGLIVLHSAHMSKPFRKLMGTTCMLRWRCGDDRELIWTVNPAHSIAQDVPPIFVIPQQEMYGEFFDIPQPDELVFISSFSGGEIFRSGCCFFRGKGRIFYFSPGHETYPVYYQPEVRQILANAVSWAYVERPSPLKQVLSLDFVSTAPSPPGWFETSDSSRRSVDGIAVPVGRGSHRPGRQL
jgi:trehalose utilization protein